MIEEHTIHHISFYYYIISTIEVNPETTKTKTTTKTTTTTTTTTQGPPLVKPTTSWHPVGAPGSRGSYAKPFGQTQTPQAPRGAFGAAKPWGCGHRGSCACLILFVSECFRGQDGIRLFGGFLSFFTNICLMVSY